MAPRLRNALLHRLPALLVFGCVFSLSLGGSLLVARGFADRVVRDARAGAQVKWERGGVVRFETQPTAEHPAPVKPGVWPKFADQLPEGDAPAGRKLFMGRLACFSCHGDPALPGGNTVGPHLGDLGRQARTRVTGLSARQYVYESVLDPNAFIVPTCANGQPCLRPSAMPYYGELLSQKDMADVVAYMVETGSDSSTTPMNGRLR
jgi:mono/diheme cytochrome c family protein